MTSRRVIRLVGPLAAIVALAVTLVLLGLALTGPARAASPQPTPTPEVFATSAPVQSAIVRFGEDVTVPNGQRVDGVVAFGGNVTVDGAVKGPVVAFGGDVLVSGTVSDAVVAFGGDVTLMPSAVVGSAMKPQDTSVVVFGGTLTRAPEAQVTGEVQRADNAGWAAAANWATQHTVMRPWWGFTLMGWIVQTAFCLVLALVVAALMPRQMHAVQRQLRLKPAGSLGWGALAFFIAGPAALVVLVISIVGLLLVVPYVMLVLFAYFFAVTTVGAFVAQRVLAGGGRTENLMLATALGVIGTTIVSRIPVLGGLVVLAMIVFGTGAAALAVLEWRQSRRTATVPPTTDTAATMTAPAIATGPAAANEASTMEPPAQGDATAVDPQADS
jgi:hypothetical protein